MQRSVDSSIFVFLYLGGLQAATARHAFSVAGSLATAERVAVSRNVQKHTNNPVQNCGYGYFITYRLAIPSQISAIRATCSRLASAAACLYQRRPMNEGIRFGNIWAALIPTALCDAAEDGLLKSVDRLTSWARGAATGMPISIPRTQF